jgi:zinc protease
MISPSLRALALAGAAALPGLVSAPSGGATTARATVGPDTTLLSYYVDSVRVIQQLSTATGVIAVNVYLLGGSRQLTPATQGMEAMLLTASKFGTRAHPDSTWRAAWAMTGSDSDYEIGTDWTMFGFRTIRDEFDVSFDLLTERLTSAVYSGDAVTLARAKWVAVLRQRRSSPDGEIGSVADSVAFSGHPYGLSPYGTEQTLATIDSAALTTYARAQIVRSRLMVVVVGAATRAMVEAAVHRGLSALPLGSYAWTPPAPPAKRTASTVTLIPRRSATNYVIGVFDGPPETSDDYPSFDAATSFLGGMISNVVREKRGLSYAASATTNDRALVTGVIYVSTPRPDTVVRLVQAQIRTITNPDSLPPGFSFTTDKNSLQYIFRRSTSASQAAALAHAQVMQGDYRLAVDVPRRLRTVTSGSIRRAAATYMKNIRYIYAGDTTLVKRATFEARR